MVHERRLKLQRYAYVLTTGLIAVIFLVFSALSFQPELTRTVITAAVILGMVSLILESGIRFNLTVAGVTSFSTVSYMAMIFVLPYPLPPLIGAVTVLLSDLRLRKHWTSLIFNASNFSLTLGITSLIWYYYSDGKSLMSVSSSISTFAILTLIVLLFYSINVFLLNGYIAILQQRPFIYIWLSQDRSTFLPYISLEVVGILLALVWEAAPIIIPFVIVPAIISYVAFEKIERLQHQTQEAMIMMADAIDARDHYTAEHSQRVTDLSLLIADSYGLKGIKRDQLELAARLHDIGKIGISNEMLHKDGPLTDEEWEIMKEHPVIGEELLKPYRQFRHEARIVRSHHERWDGLGYPDGLRRTTIPLAARIIAIADTFDAITSNRPYRSPRSEREAIEEIRNNALLQFDPILVASFLQAMEGRQKVRRLPVATTDEQEERQWSSSAQ